jgi:AraC-like DNA-binding protein
MTNEFNFDVRFYRLSPELEGYFTHLYAFDIDCGDSGHIEDLLHPEWTSMRFVDGEPPSAVVGPGAMSKKWPCTVSGPTSNPIRFRVYSSRIWGLGLQPAGWAKFVDGNACDFANRTFNASVEPAFVELSPILQLVQDRTLKPDRIAASIDRFIRSKIHRPSPQEAQIIACHQVLNDPTVSSAIELRDRLKIGARSLERLCARYFGFSPKQVLRRQRFLRSLAVYMLSAGRTWSDAMDGQYYDQAQFVRDFRSFMGMTPSEYAAAPHPIIERIIAQRMADQGALPKADLPTLLRLSQKPGPQAGKS